MPKVYFQPQYAVRYIGEEPKEFIYSLARPKPMLEKGDIVIVSKKNAFTLTKKGFGKFEEVNEIELQEALEVTDPKILEDLEKTKIVVSELEIEIGLLKTKKVVSDEEVEELESEKDDEKVLSLESFEGDKNKLEAYALEKFEIQLDKRQKIENMYSSLLDELEKRK